jgi:hypothetical protein
MTPTVTLDSGEAEMTPPSIARLIYEILLHLYLETALLGKQVCIT